MWVGFQPMSVDMLFDIPKEQQEELLKDSKNGSKYRIVNGVVKGRSASIWFTNLEHSKRNEELILYKRYNPEEYPKYDNYDAINVDKVNEIPCDYDGVMGVPITFLDKYNPKQFEIVEFRKGADGKDLVYSTTGGADSALLQNTRPSMPIAGLMNNPKDTAVGGLSKYARILIRRLP